MRPYIAEYSTTIENPDVELFCEAKAIQDLISGAKTYDELVESKAIQFKGDAEFGEKFGTLFDF